MPCPNCRCPSCLALVGSTIPSAQFSLPPSELTTANRAPTNSEVRYSRDVIRSSENMIALIQTMIDDLEKRKARLLDLISKHKAAISPLRSFPPELLVEIFERSVMMVQSHWRSGDSPPLMLMGICSQWRRVVLDTPQLWTRILTAHPMIDFWITRSKELSLNLELDLSSLDSYPALEALIPHSHRWQHIDFHLGPGSHSILARVKNRLPLLKSLSIFFGDTTGTVDFCEVAPRLTKIKLMDIFEPVDIRLPWEQLQVCTVDYTEVTHYVLQHAKNVRALHLDMTNLSVSDSLLGWVMPRNIDPHTHHLGLQGLIIQWNFMDPEINSFFSSITLPFLQSFQALFNYHDPEDSDHRDRIDASRAELAPTLARFFERSGTHLNMLKLLDIPFSQSGLIKCLAKVPSLVSLDIKFDTRWYEINEKLLDRLNVNRPKHVLPRLRSLALWRPANMFIESSLDNLIASRRHIDPKHDGVALLENLTLGCTFFRFSRGPPRLHRFVSEGLNIIYGEDWNGVDFTRPCSPATSEDMEQT